MSQPPGADPYVLGERIDTVLAARVREDPDAPAVRQGAEALSYGELWRRSAAVATGLRAAGVGPRDVVAVRMARSCDRVVTFLAVLRTGAAYLAMDPSWPAERITQVLALSGARAVVTDDGSGSDLRFGDLVGTSPGPLPDLLDGHGPASVFYTSGSSGRPKGVVVSHRGTMRILIGAPTLPFDRSSVVLQAAAVPWDMHSLELWGALLNGGCSVLLDRDQTVLDLPALRRALDAGVNTMWLTTSLFNVFADEAPEVFAPLRLLAVGGERMSAAHVRKVVAATPGRAVVNGYGPAECSMLATSYVVTAADVPTGVTDVPIGRPLPRTGVLLLDEAGRPAAPGEAGEIALTGDGVALGYLNDDEETARRFVVVEGERCYRTGDIGYFDGDGNLRYRGRADRQVKVRGVRVEPGEVEAAMEAHPEVTAAWVGTVRTSGERVELACLYSTAPGTGPVPEAKLRRHLSDILLPAMIPTALVHRPRLPLGPTGKVDAAAANALLADGVRARSSRVPQGPAHEEGRRSRFAAAVGELLGRPDLTDDDDLFDFGCTSLDAVRVAVRLSSLTGGHVTVADVHRLRTTAAIAEAARDTGTEPAPVATSAAGPAPLSRAQERFWLSEQTAPGESDNLIVLAYALHGPLDTGRLAGAARAAVTRHPVLRTVYEFEDEGPCQQTMSASEVTILVDEVPLPAGAPVDDLRATAEAVTADWWRTSFDLETDVPVRVRVCRVADDVHLFCLQVHHIAFDGWSESVLMRDLQAAYEGRELEPVGLSYADHARWERAQLERWLRADLPYWQRTLTDVPGPFLPVPDKDGDEAARVEVSLPVPAAQVRRLNEAAAGFPLASLLTAAGRALARTFDVDDLCVGTVTAGRFTAHAEDLVGYLVNPLPVVLHDVRERSATELLDTVTQQVVEALEHARTPFDELVRVLRPARDRHPWFQVWVVLQSPRPAGEFAAGVTMRPLRIRPPRTSLELMLEAVPDQDGSWELVVLRRADGLDPATEARLTDRLREAIDEIAGQRISPRNRTP